MFENFVKKIHKKLSLSNNQMANVCRELELRLNCFEEKLVDIIAAYHQNSWKLTDCSEETKTVGRFRKI